jgi:hypothetical protein
MLLAAKIPREFREYAKLLRRVGVGSWGPIIEQQVDRNNPYVFSYYLQGQLKDNPPVTRRAVFDAEGSPDTKKELYTALREKTTKPSSKPPKN